MVGFVFYKKDSVVLVGYLHRFMFYWGNNRSKYKQFSKRIIRSLKHDVLEPIQHKQLTTIYKLIPKGERW